MTRQSDRFRRNCFIVAPHENHLRAFLKDALQHRSIDSVAVEDISEIGGSVTSLISVIKNSDFVCVVFPPDQPSMNIVFETGLALGLGKPTLIFTLGDPSFPLDLKSISVVRLVDLSRPLAIENQLDAFLRTLPPRRLSKKPSKPKSETSEVAEWARGVLAATQNFGSERQLEQLIAESFERAGYSVTVAPPGEDYGADMAVWSPDLKRKLGNPLLIEVKTGNVLPPQLRQVTDRLTRMIRNGQGSIALLVSPTINAHSQRSIGTEAPVFHWAVNDLLESLGSDNLVDELISSREQFLTRKM